MQTTLVEDSAIAGGTLAGHPTETAILDDRSRQQSESEDFPGDKKRVPGGPRFSGSGFGGARLSLGPLLVIAALLVILYDRIAFKLVSDWYNLPDFSHGFLIPFFAAFLLWDMRYSLQDTPVVPSWTGLSLVVLGLFELLIGVFGADLFLQRTSFVLITAGIVWTLFGRAMLVRVKFVLFVLLLAIPLPTIVFNQITFPLQLLASSVASGLLPLAGVPVLRDGNIIQLPAMPLEVAEACSGIRSLMSLFTVAVIYGYFLERKTWKRVVLALASIPIAVTANAARIFGTGLCVQYWDPEKAMGFFHEFSGWLIFLVSLSFLYLVHVAMRMVAPGKSEARMISPRFLVLASLMSATALLLHARGDVDRVPPSRPLNELPSSIDRRVATDIPLDDEVLQVLGKGIFLNRVYAGIPGGPTPPDGATPVGLFIGFFPTQRTGQSIHSPQNCLPGAGWTFQSSGVTDLKDATGKTYQVGEYIIANGGTTQEVLYWYRVHGRSVASDYKAKLYTLADSIRYSRTDAALVRVITGIAPAKINSLRTGAR